MMTAAQARSSANHKPANPDFMRIQNYIHYKILHATNHNEYSVSIVRSIIPSDLRDQVITDILAYGYKVEHDNVNMIIHWSENNS